jgi:hypothetical protein
MYFTPVRNIFKITVLELKIQPLNTDYILINQVNVNFQIYHAKIIHTLKCMAKK